MADIEPKSSRTLRRRVYEALEPTARQAQGLSITNKCLVGVIIIATLVAILSTEELLFTRYKFIFETIEIGLGFVFLLEYMARIWVAVEHVQGSGNLKARLKFIFSISGLLDLAVIVATLTPLFVANVALLRLFRLLRVLRLSKLGRMSMAMRNLNRAIHSRRYELGLTVGLAMAFMLFGAAGLYWIEGELQPDKFGSIPRALWWAVITMTTIGYGDVFPITTLGKIVASLVAFAGIGLIAMPTGILAAAFSDAIQKSSED